MQDRFFRFDCRVCTVYLKGVGALRVTNLSRNAPGRLHV